MTRSQIAEHERRRRVGLAVQRLRRAENFTQTEFGAKCDPPITPRRLALLERGFARIRPEEIEALTRALPALAHIFRPLIPGVAAGKYAPRSTVAADPEPSA